MLESRRMNARNRYAALAVVFVASLVAATLFHFFPVSIVGGLAGNLPRQHNVTLSPSAAAR